MSSIPRAEGPIGGTVICLTVSLWKRGNLRRVLFMPVAIEDRRFSMDPDGEQRNSEGRWREGVGKTEP